MAPPAPLSAREREIVAGPAGGATDAQIAERLLLSVSTVRSHLDRIRDKTGGRRRAERVRYAHPGRHRSGRLLQLSADDSLSRRSPPPEGEWAVRPTPGGLDGAVRPLLSRLRPGLRSVYCSAAEAETRTSVYPPTVTAF